MFENTLLFYIVTFMLLEVYEVQWQKAQTMIGMLARMYQHYQKSIFLFLFMHPTFYLSIYLMMLTDFNTYAVAIFIMKGVDIATKIIFIKKIFIDKDLSREMSLALLAPLNRYILYIGLLIYPPLIYLALTKLTF